MTQHLNNAKDIETYFDRLWPICRSITGNGLRASFHILREIIPLHLTEVPSGTAVFDWEIPDEWNIREAWIEGPDGVRYADFSKNNLHIVNYSIPFSAKITAEELFPHIYSLPQYPDRIPYMTSYYKRDWGFCVSQEELSRMPRAGTYHVHIDATLEPGSLTYGEIVVPGTSDREVLISTYLCHPSMAINELSGPLVTAFLYRELLRQFPERKFSYRFVIAPETIGVIAYLAERGQHLLTHLDAGFVVTCVGDDQPFNYKLSKRGNSEADRITQHILKYSGVPYAVRPFAIGGSDERQYCSAGFNLPVGSLMRTPYKEYNEYHTSADNKSILSFDAMAQTVDMYVRIFRAMERNEKYTVKQPFCELRLGKRNLYSDLGGNAGLPDFTALLLHFLSYADGTKDLIEIAELRNVSVEALFQVVDLCKQHDLIY